MADTSVGVFLRADMVVTPALNKVHGPWMDIKRSVKLKADKDGFEAEEDTTDLTLYMPTAPEDSALVCDMFIAAFQRVKDSLPESVR